MHGEGNEVTVEYYDNTKHELGRIPLLGFPWSVSVNFPRACNCIFNAEACFQFQLEQSAVTRYKPPLTQGSTDQHRYRTELTLTPLLSKD